MLEPGIVSFVEKIDLLQAKIVEIFFAGLCPAPRRGCAPDPHPVTIMHTPSGPAVAAPGSQSLDIARMARTLYLVGSRKPLWRSMMRVAMYQQLLPFCRAEA